MQLIDTHCHIVFGVDDGSYSENESVRMAKIAVRSGITDIIATPHCIPGMFENYAGPEYEEAFRRLEEALDENGLGGALRIHRGMETFSSDELIEQFDSGMLHFLGDSNYLLIECDFSEDPRRFREVLERLIRREVRPVIAHPERYYFAHDDIKYLFDMVDMGCVLQLDTESIVGHFGRRCRECAINLLAEGAAQLAGSDAHDSGMRTPDMREAADFVADRFSGRYAELLFDENPARILNNRRLLFPGESMPPKPPRPQHPKRRKDGFMSDEEYWGV